jgi:hypothetical protein
MEIAKQMTETWALLMTETINKFSKEAANPDWRGS